ncbi:hypothetical protein BASA62_001830 [Batrachochytrium salamandrivorans]|nr:hypothetical protein BASA62_001830 [Batrachochytrium salamandrivorans]
MDSQQQQPKTPTVVVPLSPGSTATPTPPTAGIPSNSITAVSASQNMSSTPSTLLPPGSLQQPSLTPSTANLGFGGGLAASIFGTAGATGVVPSIQHTSTSNSQAAAYSSPIGSYQSVLSPQVIRSLSDKVYEKRKAAAIEIEKLVRDALVVNDDARICAILVVLAHEFAYSVVPNTRNGGLIGLAAAAIALGSAIESHLPEIVPPMLACFSDQDSRVRYYASEALYNVCKVARASVLIYFNEIFDALCKLSVDQESSVKSGAGLLDRIIKDIVSERSTYYHPEIERRADSSTHTPSKLSASLEGDLLTGNRAVPISVPVDSSSHPLSISPTPNIFPPVPGTAALRPGMSPTSFNLPRFIPLLAERIYVVTPAARIFLVQWIYLLSSIPDLELVSYLPDFLDGLFRFLSDPNVDVRTATLNVLVEFLREIREIVQVQHEHGFLNLGLEKTLPIPEESIPIVNAGGDESSASELPIGVAPKQPIKLYVDGADELPPIEQALHPNMPAVLTNANGDGESAPVANFRQATISFDTTASPSAPPHPSSTPYIPGQGVALDFGKMTQILVPHLLSQDEETQATALRWINEFTLLAKDSIIPFMPLILQPILRTLSHSVLAIRGMAIETNSTLYTLVLEWNGNMTTALVDSLLDSNTPQTDPNAPLARPDDGVGASSGLELDISACVNILTLLFQDKMEYTRAAAIDWLSMLHQKAPEMVMHSSDQRTFQALLGTLSDLSEEVVKRDLQLLAQISHHSDDQYFTNFMDNLLTLFSTDRRLLETRGNLIIRQLCFSLNPERMYRSFAELIEKEEDIEFASTMVQNLNLILVTSPELAELRRRLKNLESRDGSALFATLYRSWCHNAVAVLSLCLLAQAYEHASHLVSTFGDLEITVPLLVQIDKLVQLLESPVFTYLRLQLLEPDRYPHLFKCLYGILMLLPQSSAFATLRNRLSSVGPLISLYNTPNGLGTIPTATNLTGSSQSSSTSSQSASHSTRSHRSKSGGVAPVSVPTPTHHHQQSETSIRWQDLIAHFRTVQHRQERSRRQATRLGSTDRSHRNRHDGNEGLGSGSNGNEIPSMLGHNAITIMNSGGEGAAAGSSIRKERTGSIPSLATGSNNKFRGSTTQQTISDTGSTLPLLSAKLGGSGVHSSSANSTGQTSRSGTISRRGPTIR